MLKRASLQGVILLPGKLMAKIPLTSVEAGSCHKCMYRVPRYTPERLNMNGLLFA